MADPIVQTPTELANNTGQVAPSYDNGGNFVPSSSQNSNVITSAALTPETPTKVVTPTPDTTNHTAIIAGSAADLQAKSDKAAADAKALQSSTNDQNNPNSISNKIVALEGQDSNKAVDTQTAMDASGATALAKQLDNLNTQAKNLNLAAQAIPIQTQERNANTGATDAGVAPQNAGALRENALQALSISQQANIATGNFNAASKIAQQAIDAKYLPLENQIKTLQDQYNMNKDALVAADKTAATALQLSISKQAADIADKKQTETENATLQNTWAQNAYNGGQSDVAAKISQLDPGSPTFKADMVGLQSQVKPSITQALDIQNKELQNAKLRKDLMTSSTTNLSTGQESMVNQTLTAMASNKQIAAFQQVQDNYNVIQAMKGSDPASQAAALAAFVQMAVPGSKSLKGSAGLITSMFGTNLSKALISAEKTVNDVGTLSPADIASINKASDIIYGQQTSNYNNARSQYVQNLNNRGVPGADNLLLNFAPQLSSNPNLTAKNITFSLQSKAGKDGKVSPDNYNQMKHLWITNGGDAPTFDNSFGSFKNPNNPNY